MSVKNQKNMGMLNMDNVPKHTPTPWIVRNLLSVEAQTDGKAIAICVPCPKDGNMARINAAFIVEACNAHAALIEENERLRKALVYEYRNAR